MLGTRVPVPYNGARVRRSFRPDRSAPRAGQKFRATHPLAYRPGAKEGSHPNG